MIHTSIRIIYFVVVCAQYFQLANMFQNVHFLSLSTWHLAVRPKHRKIKPCLTLEIPKNKYCKKLHLVLFITGEAAGLAMGLVMLGTKHANAIEDMLAVSIQHLHSIIGYWTKQQIFKKERN